MADRADNQKMMSCDELLQKKVQRVADKELERLGFPNVCKKNASKTIQRVLELDKSQQEIKSLYSQLGLRMAKLSAMDNEKKKISISAVSGTSSATTVDSKDVSLILRKPTIHSSFPSAKNMKREDECFSIQDKHEENNNHSRPKYIKTSVGGCSIVNYFTIEARDNSYCAPISLKSGTQCITNKEKCDTNVSEERVAHIDDYDVENDNKEIDCDGHGDGNIDTCEDKDDAEAKTENTTMKDKKDNKEEEGGKELDIDKEKRNQEQVNESGRDRETLQKNEDGDKNEEKNEIEGKKEEKTQNSQKSKNQQNDEEEEKEEKTMKQDEKEDKGRWIENENGHEDENENDNEDENEDEAENESGIKTGNKNRNQNENISKNNKGKDENDNKTEGGSVSKKHIDKEIVMSNGTILEREKKNEEEQVGEPDEPTEKEKSKMKTVGKDKIPASKKQLNSLKEFKGVIEQTEDVQIGSIVYAKPDGSDAWFEAEVEKDITDTTSRSKIKTKSSQLRFLGGKGLRQTIPFNRIASKSCVGVADIEIGSRVVASRPSDTVSSTVLKKCKTLSKGNIVDVIYAGVVAELACQENFYRYLVFFDDGYAQYHHLQKLFLVVKPCFPVWIDVSEHCRGFIKEYLEDYPSRPFLQADVSSIIRTEWDGEWWESKVVAYDASLVKIHYDSDSHTEWIYRGTTRLEPIHDYFNSTKHSMKKKKKKKNNEETKYERSEVCIDERLTDPQFGISKYSLRDPNGVQQRVEWNVPSPSLELIARQTSAMSFPTKGKIGNSKSTINNVDDEGLKSALDEYSIMSQKEVFDVLDALQSQSS